MTDTDALTELPPSREVFDSPHFGEDHPMRKVTRQIAFEDAAWDATRAGKIADLFDGMAAEWTADHDREGRYAPLEDALERGLDDWTSDANIQVVELGSGTGLGTRTLATRFAHITACDLALGMLQQAPATYGQRVQADASCLPLRNGAADLLVMVNMLLFPDEVNRVLAPDGRLVWVNTMGEQTPIHLPASDVLKALPGTWRGTASRAAHGTWAVARRK